MRKHRHGYLHADGTYRIPLTQGQEAVIDPEFWFFDKWLWVASWHQDSKCFYVKRSVNWPHHHMLYLHRELLSARKGQEVDHVNHNGLDNRLENLRIVTRAQNMMNRRSIHGVSQFKGVSWHEKAKKWRANIRLGRQQHLGFFSSEIEAALAYNKAARELFGPYALLNPIKKEVNNVGLK